MNTIAVVGASLAGLRSVQQLRAQGFDGRIVVIGAESHAPYDRPPLSKAFLAGRSTAADLVLDDELEGLAAEWRLGIRVERLNPATRTLALSDGTEVAADGVVVATGGRARALPGAARSSGVHTLRTMDDALALREDLAAGVRHVVIVGAGWVGAEVASTCHELGLDVTAVATTLPFVRAFGQRIARVCSGLHADHGVALRCGAGVARLQSTPGGRVAGVVLADGTHLPADAVVAGVGMDPVTDWLAGSGLAVDAGVLCDAGCVTALPNVVAVGDVARYRAANGQYRRHGHWTNAAEQPAVAVANLLAGATLHTYRPSGYVWSDQYGVRLQVTGDIDGADDVEIVDGSPDDRKFVAAYRKGGETVGAFGMDSVKLFTRMRKQLDRARVPALG